MSESVLVKKRGRPKKVSLAPDTTVHDAAEASSTSKKSASTKKGAADQTPNAQDVPAKKSRRKAVKSTTAADDASASSTKVLHSSATPILVTDAPTSTPVLVAQGEVNSPAVPSEPEETHAPMQATSDSSTTRTVGSSTTENLTSPVSDAVNQQAPSTQQEHLQPSTASNHQRSSFLSSFLDKNYKEEAPSITESAKISDRSAFTQQQIPFEDIVKGDGVSTIPSPKSSPIASSPILSSLSTATKPQPTTAPERCAFAPLKIQAFPDSRQPSTSPTKTRLNIPPESFSSSSFMAFKESASLQARAKPAPVKPAPPTTTHFSRPPQPPTQPPLATPKYTEMPYDQIKKLPEYRAKRWFWTKMMVGIPVSLVASWFLWKRLEAWQVQRRKMVGLMEERPRQRGVLNSKSPDVGANGSV